MKKLSFLLVLFVLGTACQKENTPEQLKKAGDTSPALRLRQPLNEKEEFLISEDQMTALDFSRNFDLIIQNTEMIKTTKPGFPLDEFISDIEAIEMASEIDEIFQRYGIGHMVSYKAAMNEIVRITPLIDSDVVEEIRRLQGTWDPQEPPMDPAKGNCFKDCYDNYKFEAALCVAEGIVGAAATGGLGAWIGVACILNVGYQLDLCYDKCRG